MGIVLLDITTSLDGYVAGPNDGPEKGLGERGGEKLHDWLFTGDTPNRHDPFFKTSGPSTAIVDEMFARTGAIICGRRTYDIAGAWGGSHPLGRSLFVVTRRPPGDVPRGKTAFTFVDSVKSALRQAKAAAGDKDVMVMGGASIAQQYLAAGLLDELRLHVAPRLLGGGRSLFGELADAIELETVSVVAAPGVTHLTYRPARL